jgi:YfiH family protein
MQTLATHFAAEGLDWIVPDWPAPASVRAFCTTRNAGGSPFDVGRTAAAADVPIDTRAQVMANRGALARFLPSPPVWLDQVHGSDVVVVDRPDATAGERWPRADAAVTRAADVVLAVRVADCLPVLFSDAAGAVVAIAHAGWRGLAAGVLENTVGAMACPPDSIVAWLGPAIGATAFEVGDDVRDAFVDALPATVAAFVRGAPGKWHASLDVLARQRLARAGVTRVSRSGLCTASDPARFFSFRREHATGRMASFIWTTAR